MALQHSPGLFLLVAEHRQPQRGRCDSCSTRGDLGGLHCTAGLFLHIASPSKGTGWGRGTMAGSRFGALTKHQGTPAMTRVVGRLSSTICLRRIISSSCHVVCVWGVICPCKFVTAPRFPRLPHRLGGQLSPAWPGWPRGSSGGEAEGMLGRAEMLQSVGMLAQAGMLECAGMLSTWRCSSVGILGCAGMLQHKGAPACGDDPVQGCWSM